MVVILSVDGHLLLSYIHFHFIFITEEETIIRNVFSKSSKYQSELRKKSEEKRASTGQILLPQGMCSLRVHIVKSIHGRCSTIFESSV